MDYSADIEQVELLKSGNPNAFSALFRKYSERLYAFSLSITREPYIAEEITQLVFIKVWERRDRIDEYLSFKSFLFSITYSETISWLRKEAAEKKKINHWGENLTFSSNQTAQMVEFNNLEGLVQQVIAELPEKRREIFKLSREQGFTNKEIADRLGLSVKTIENQMTSALRTMKEKLGHDGVLTLLYFSLNKD